MAKVFRLHQPFWITVLEWGAVVVPLRTFVLTAPSALNSILGVLAGGVVVTTSMACWTRREDRSSSGE